MPEAWPAPTSVRVGVRPQPHVLVAPTACVLGGLDIINPLVRAGIRCAAAVSPDNPARWSRHVQEIIEPLDPWHESQAYVDRLVRWATGRPTPPVLYYPTDGDLLMVSRHRAELAEVFAFAIPDEELVEDLVDKERFRLLAERVGLPVPPSRYLRCGADPAEEHRLGFPVVVKPVARRNAGELLVGKGKAIRVDSPEELREIRHRAHVAGVDCVVQILVPGPETRIESYHAFVDTTGSTVEEFTGAKLRTYPAEYGESTAITVGRRADVLAAGRAVLAAIGLRDGVAKVDFKRAPDGRLWLLEVNPRFNLWHHPAAVAGANLPAAVHAYLTGRARPPARPFRGGVTWCDVRNDRHAAAAAGLPHRTWLEFLARSSTRSFGTWADPMPLVRGVALPALRQRLSAMTGGRRGG